MRPEDVQLWVLFSNLKSLLFTDCTLGMVIGGMVIGNMVIGGVVIWGYGL